MKFVIGVAVGYWLFHPYNENSKLDRASYKVIRKGGDKLVEFAIKRVEKVFG